MVKKQKQTSKSNKRSKSIERTILESQGILNENLGRTRSQRNTRISKGNQKLDKRPQKINKRIKKSDKQSKQLEKDTPQKKINVESDVKHIGLSIKDQTVNQTQPRRTSSKQSAGIVDVVFCCDTTRSMKRYLQQTSKTVSTIVTNIREKCSADNIDVKFGFVCYRDHPPQCTTYVTKMKDLCSDQEIIQFISGQDVSSGGDIPEAVLDGLFVAAKNISWRNTINVPSLRYIFHIADAPPHGREFSNKGAFRDGVPSGITLDKVVHEINIREIHYRLIKIGFRLGAMASLFKERFTNYEETVLNDATKLNISVSDMIIREIFNDVEY